MENKTRQPFKKYKELRVYFALRTYVLKQDDYETDMDRPFEWFKFSSRGVIIKDKVSGMEIHFKYSDVSTCDGSYSRGLVLGDVELFTPFIKEDDNKVKFITWKEWETKYDTEAICKRITTVTDEHLKEHDTDLMYILDKLCACAADRNFDHPHRFIKVEPRYQDNEYSLHRVAADFKWHYGAKMYDYNRYLFEYEVKNRTIHIDIGKHETWYMPTPIFSYGICPGNMPDDYKTDEYSIDVEFNKDYSISKVTVKNKNKENLLKFMEMGNPVIKNTIRQIRDYINAKLTEKQLTSRINVTNEKNKYVQTWNFSPRVDVSIEKILKANERAEAYMYEPDYNVIVKRLNEICDYPRLTFERTSWDHTYRDYDQRLRAIYVNPFHMEILLLHTNYNDPYYAKIVIDFDSHGMICALSYDDPASVSGNNKFREFNELREFIENRAITPDRDADAYVTQEFDKLFKQEEFKLNKHSDIYDQLKKEIDSIYCDRRLFDKKRTNTCCGELLTLYSGSIPEREKFEFYLADSWSTNSHKLTIEVLDPNKSKLKISVTFENSELTSVSSHPGLANFEKMIKEIYNPRVCHLVSEIFYKLYKGEE